MVILMLVKKIVPAIISILAAAFISGCAQSQNNKSIIAQAFDGTELIPADVNRICITEVTNNSSYDDIPKILKSDMKRKINTGGRLYLTDDINSCDVRISITLLPLLSEPLNFNASGIPREKRLRIDALVTMEHASTGIQVIKNRDTYAEFIYSVTGRDSISEYRGITGLTEKLSERIISVITTGWYKEDNLKRSGR